jgi:tetratricopeptide (TPR) repeat protein
MSDKKSYLSQLRDVLVKTRNLDELRIMAYDMGILYEDLRGEGITARMLDFLIKVTEKGKLEALLEYLRADTKRKNIEWPPLPEGFDLEEEINILTPDIPKESVILYWLPLVGGLLVIAVVVLAFVVLYQTNGKGDTSTTMGGVWNIAVAGFTAVGENPVSQEEVDAVTAVFYEQIKPEIANLRGATSFSIDLWGPNQTKSIFGETADVRDSNALARAEEIGASIIIYGTVERSGSSLRINPEFLVPIADQAETQELVGQHAFGRSLLQIRPGQDPLEVIRLSQELSRRAQALTAVAGGLMHYVIQEYEVALDGFNAANDVEFWETSTDGRQVVYQLLGNTYKTLYRFDEAEAAYLAALDVDSDYARALLGVGDIYFLRSLECGKPDCYDQELLDQAMAYFQAARSSDDHPILAEIPVKAAFLEGRVYMARWFMGQDTVAEAEARFNEVVAAYGDGEKQRLIEWASEAHALLGFLAAEKHDSETAIGEYQAAYDLALHPARRGQFATSLADLYAEAGNGTAANEQYELAVEQFNIAVGLPLNDEPEVKAVYHAYLADCYLKLTEFQAAVEALEKAVRFLPEGSSFEYLLIQETVQNAVETIPNEKGLQLRLEELNGRLAEKS